LSYAPTAFRMWETKLDYSIRFFGFIVRIQAYLGYALC